MKKEIEKKENNLEEPKIDEKTSNKMRAKRDFRIFFNDLDIKIKKGDDVSKLNLEQKFITNLKTEKII